MPEHFSRRSIWRESRSRFSDWTSERLRLLDAATTAPAWPNVMKQAPGKAVAQIPPEVAVQASSGTGARTEAGKKTRQAIEAACQALAGCRRRAY